MAVPTFYQKKKERKKRSIFSGQYLQLYKTYMLQQIGSEQSRAATQGLFGCLLRPTRLALGSLGAFGLAEGMQKGLFGYMHDWSSV